MKDSWNMTDEEFNESYAIEAEEVEIEKKPPLITKKDADKIWDEIEKEYGY